VPAMVCCEAVIRPI